MVGQKRQAEKIPCLPLYISVNEYYGFPPGRPGPPPGKPGLPLPGLGCDVIPKRLQDANDVRWQIEELHPGTKQLTKTEKCPCHKGRSQRHHKAIAIMPGFS